MGVLGRHFDEPHYRLITRNRNFFDISREVRKLISEYSLDFFHFAAIVGDQNLKRETASLSTFNESLTALLANEVNREPNSKFHLISTGHVYGPSAKKIDELQIPKPIGVYAKSKLLSEIEAMKAFKHSPEKLKIYRVFSLLGNQMNPGSLSHYIQKAHLEPEKNPIRNSLDIRDFLHPRTAVNALMQISKIDTPEMIFNICSGVELTVRSAVEIFFRKNGLSPKKLNFVEENSSVPKLLGNAERLTGYIGKELIKKDFLHARE
jgi:nucleoside-diphosphate-sugar epimerase